MTTKAYLIRLEGMGDSDWKIVDQLTWDFIEAIEQQGRYGIPPHVPEELISRSKEQYGEDDLDEIKFYLTVDSQSGSWNNDIWMCLPNAPFDGEIFGGENFRDVRDFCAKHNLEIVDELEGSLY